MNFINLKISLFVSGKMLTEIINDKMTNGKHEVKPYVNQLSKGVYTFVLESNDKKETLKSFRK